MAGALLVLASVFALEIPVLCLHRSCIIGRLPGIYVGFWESLVSVLMWQALLNAEPLPKLYGTLD